MIEILKTFFGNSVSALEAFCGLVSIGSIIMFFITIIKIVYEGKKSNRNKAEIKKDCENKINDFKAQYETEITTLKQEMKKNINNLADMLLLEATKSGVDVEKFKEIVSIYKDTAIELLDTEKLIENKEKEEEQTQATQEQVNENLNNIDKVLNDLV